MGGVAPIGAVIRLAPDRAGTRQRVRHAPHLTHSPTDPRTDPDNPGLYLIGA